MTLTHPAAHPAPGAPDEDHPQEWRALRGVASAQVRIGGFPQADRIAATLGGLPQYGVFLAAADFDDDGYDPLRCPQCDARMRQGAIVRSSAGDVLAWLEEHAKLVLVGPPPRDGPSDA